METRGEGGLDEKDQTFKLSALGKGVFFCSEKCNFQGRPLMHFYITTSGFI